MYATQQPSTAASLEKAAFLGHPPPKKKGSPTYLWKAPEFDGAGGRRGRQSLNESQEPCRRAAAASAWRAPQKLAEDT